MKAFTAFIWNLYDIILSNHENTRAQALFDLDTFNPACHGYPKQFGLRVSDNRYGNVVTSILPYYPSIFTFKIMKVSLSNEG